MAIRETRLDALEERHLVEQVERGIPELRTVDYKLKLPGNGDAERKEFLADVCSFANAGGGDLVFGIDEEGGTPTKLAGVELEDPDAAILALENVIRDGLDPRLIGFSSQYVKLSNGKHVVVVRVPRSFDRPHAVDYKNRWRFYTRSSAGKYPMDVSEVRSAFVLSESVANRMRSFRAQRLSDIVSGQAPVSMNDAATTVLHLMPLSAFDTPEQRLDLTTATRSNSVLSPITLGGPLQYNFDGVLCHGQYADWQQEGPQSYALLFRSGIVEAADSELLWPSPEPRMGTDKIIPIIKFERDLLEATERYLALTAGIGVEGPIFVSLSLLGARGYVLPHGFPISRASHPIDRDSLQVPEVMAESPRLNRESLERLMQPIFDSVWNACGFSGCAHYDENGRWHTR